MGEDQIVEREAILRRGANDYYLHHIDVPSTFEINANRDLVRAALAAGHEDGDLVRYCVVIPGKPGEE